MGTHCSSIAQFVVAIYFIYYVIVIPYPRGLYGIYCLNPRAKAINPMWPKGVWYNYLKPTMATHLHYYSNASFIDVIRPQP